MTVLFIVTIAGTMHRARIVAEDVRPFPRDRGFLPVPLTFTSFRLSCGRFGLMSTVDFRKLMAENANHMKHCEKCVAEGGD